jgi:Ca2+-binding RTX toxin-like protein
MMTDIIINTTASNGTTTNLGPNNVSQNGASSVIIIPTVNNVILDADGITITGITFNFAANMIKVGNGNDTVYGTMFDLDLTAIHGGTISNCTFNYGSNVIKTGNGHDVVYGTMHDLNVTATNGGVISGNDITFGTLVGSTLVGNTIVVGNGAGDQVYGDMANLTITLNGGDSPASGTHASVQLINSKVTFGDNQLTAGNGDNQLVGNVGTVNITLEGGDLVSGAGTIATATMTNTPITFGNDTLIDGNGNDQLYGDVQSMSYILTGGSNVTSVSGGDTTINGSALTFGNDTLTAGNGIDSLYGDAQNFDISINGGSNNPTDVAGRASIRGGSSFTFGNDTLTAGNGDDHLYGDVQTVDYTFLSGSNDAGLFAGAATFSVASTTFGADHLTSGDGNDWLFGDVQAFNITCTAGSGIGGVGSLTATAGMGNLTPVTFGNDTLTAGNGNDHLYGDVQSMTYTLQAGSNAIGSNTGDVGAFAGMGTNTGLGSPVTFGNDHLVAGTGNDILYGDGETFSAMMHGGIANVSPGVTFVGALAALGEHLDTRVGSSSPITFGNDTLQVHSLAGAGDVLYGDWKVLNINLHDGQVIGTPQVGGVYLVRAEIDSPIQLGNNTLIGGDGNDTLVGGIGTINFQHLDGAGNLITDNILDPNSNVAHFLAGDNILYGGAGNDVITGGSIDLTGNFGHDQFVYDGGIVNGHDQIRDFHVALDTLVGQNGATFTDGGLVGGNQVINVHDAGVNSTITLLNVHTDIFASIMQTHATVVHP